MSSSDIDIILKNNQTSGVVPAPQELILGEIALNTADGIIYTKLNDGSVVAIGGSGEPGYVTWGSIVDKPVSFTPSSHNHSIGDITNLQTSLDSKANLEDVDNLETLLDTKATLVDNKISFQNLPFTVSYPVKAVHIGGMFAFNDFAYTAYPTYYWDGSVGDMRTLETMQYPNTSINVSVQQSLNKYLSDFPDRTLNYASLEIALIDSDNRIVGWGTTSTSNVPGTTNGTDGIGMTISLFSFPSGIPNSWVIGGNNDGSPPSAELFPFTQYKKVSSKYLYSTDDIPEGDNNLYYTAARSSAVQTILDSKVNNDDSRLSDARTPTYHTHSITGLDNNVVGVTAIGTNALEYLSNNSVDAAYLNNYSTAIGSEALSNSMGINNTAVGYGVLKSNTVGTDNVCLGAYSAELNVSGVRNIALGSYAGKNITTGGGNIGLGFSSLETLTTGLANIGLGSYALGGLTVGVDNIGVGRFTSLSSGSHVGCIILGSYAQAQASGELVIGSTTRAINTTTSVGASGPVSVASLPSKPLGYLWIRLNGSLVRIPYYN